MPEIPYRAIFDFIVEVEGINSLSKAIGVEKCYIMPSESIMREVRRYYDYQYPDNALYLNDIKDFNDLAKDRWLMWSKNKQFVYIPEGLVEYETMNEVITSVNMWDLTFFKHILWKRYRADSIKSYEILNIDKMVSPFVNIIHGTSYPISNIFFDYRFKFIGQEFNGRTEMYRWERREGRKVLIVGIEEVLAKFKTLSQRLMPMFLDLNLYIEFPLISERYINYRTRGETSVSKLRQNVAGGISALPQQDN